MNESRKVLSHHLERDAYLYIRQSSMKQVVENIESTKRQYALRGRATALGWPQDRIVVIDFDQGESGASAAWRDGVRRLVTDVGLGRAGIVMGLEVSRLARFPDLRAYVSGCQGDDLGDPLAHLGLRDGAVVLVHLLSCMHRNGTRLQVPHLR